MLKEAVTVIIQFNLNKISFLTSCLFHKYFTHILLDYIFWVRFPATAGYNTAITLVSVEVLPVCVCARVCVTGLSVTETAGTRNTAHG